MAPNPALFGSKAFGKHLNKERSTWLPYPTRKRQHENNELQWEKLGTNDGSRTEQTAVGPDRSRSSRPEADDGGTRTDRNSDETANMQNGPSGY